MSRFGSEPLGSRTGDRYRTVPEASIIQMLLLAGFAFELAKGREAEAAKRTAAALERWIATGLGFCLDTPGKRLFDPVEVLNFAKRAGLLGHDTFWRDHWVSTGRALVASGPGSRPGNFAVSFNRCFDLQHFAPGSALRLRLPLPLTGATDIRPVIAPSLSARIAFGDGRMEVRLDRPRDPIVDVGLDLVFADAGRSMPDAARPLDAAETELYLRPSEGLIRVSPRIRALADRLVGKAPTPRQKLAAFWDFMLDHLVLGHVHYDQVPSDAPGEWVLDQRWCDCQLGAALLVSLCRASSIPARILGGHVLYPLAPFNHYWAEAWVDGHGWFPMDLMTWDLSVAGEDHAWRGHFFGAIDSRLVTQCLPLGFTGPMSVRFPAGWQMVQTRAEAGIDIAFTDHDGTLIYRDRVSVRRLTA
jgi:hypothetical protein